MSLLVGVLPPMPSARRGSVGELRPTRGDSSHMSVSREGSYRRVFGGLLEVRVLVSAWTRTFTPAGKTPSTAAAPLSRENASERWGVVSAALLAALPRTRSAASGEQARSLDWVLRLVYLTGTVLSATVVVSLLHRPGRSVSQTCRVSLCSRT